MKSTSRILCFLLLAVLPITLLAQNPTIIVAYMKVAPEHVSDYLEVEQAWKKLHQKAVDAGLYNSWQLWRNVHAAADDPYQYITIQWYDNYEHTFGENAPEEWFEGAYTEAEWAELMEKTMASRTYACQEVAHQVTAVDNPGQVKYLLVSRMKVKPGMDAEYVKMEKEIFKPYHEELIKRGLLTQWNVWNAWPYKEGKTRYATVNGFGSVKQLTAPGEEITPEELGLDVTWEQVVELVQKTRDRVSSELWELVDYVMPEE